MNFRLGLQNSGTEGDVLEGEVLGMRGVWGKTQTPHRQFHQNSLLLSVLSVDFHLECRLSEGHCVIKVGFHRTGFSPGFF